MSYNVVWAMSDIKKIELQHFQGEDSLASYGIQIVVDHLT
jgi:hypothetical protein